MRWLVTPSPAAISDSPRDRRSQGRAVLAIGLAHFIFPTVFDPINNLGFPGQARTFTYINGAIEAAIGGLMAIPRTRRLSNALSACYVVYLTSSVIRAQVLRRTRDDRGSRPSG